MRSEHDSHFAAQPAEILERLLAIQAEVERRVPDAERSIGYGMPAFRLKRIFLYFAAFKTHIGVYPPVHGPAELVERLGPWRGPKGNLQFPHRQPLPTDLIGEVAARLAEQYAG